MIRMVDLSKNMFYRQGYDISGAAARTKDFAPHCLQDGARGIGRDHKADGQIRDNSRSGCPYPTLGHILHLSDFAALDFLRRCSSRSMQMESVFQEEKKT